MISIIGGGEWGSALALTSTRAGNNTVVYRRNKTGTLHKELTKGSAKITNNLQDALNNTDVIFIAIPAQSIRDICQQIKKHIIGNNIPIVICSKGIEQGTLALMSDIVKEELSTDNILILSGPNFASEIRNNLPSTSTLASENYTTAINIQSLISSDNFKIEVIDDLIGIQICSALKNVLAIACGIVEGNSKWGKNIYGSVVAKGIMEIDKLIGIMHGNRNTLFRYCGIGDLFLTCSSKESRNTLFGTKINENIDIKEYIKHNTVEGYHTAKSVYELITKYNISLDLYNTIYHILYDNMSIDNLIKVL